MVGAYIILAGLFCVFMESGLITWPWYLLYSFVVIRRVRSDGWLYLLMVLGILADVLTFRPVGLSPVLMMVLVLVERFFQNSHSAFWYLEPVFLTLILSVWCRVNDQPWWYGLVFAAIFVVVGYMVRKRENFVSLR